MTTVCWFSAGAPSAVAAKLSLANGPCEIAYTDPGSEHADNARFLDDCEVWFGQEVLRLRSTRYANTWDVFEKTRFLVSPFGARCTIELKKKVRQLAYPDPTTVHVFGYTVDEQHRADRFREQNPGVTLLTPLVDHGLTASDCKAMVERAGIELPITYRLGYEHANCIGCVKASGMGYWNKIRDDFPEVFTRMALLERDIGHSVCKDGNGPVWLDELERGRGDYATEPKIDCSLFCAIAEGSYASVDGEG